MRGELTKGRKVVPRDSPTLENCEKNKGIPRYPTGPILESLLTSFAVKKPYPFLNPLNYGQTIASDRSSLNSSVNPLITQNKSLFSVLKFPVNFTGICQEGSHKSMNKGAWASLTRNTASQWPALSSSRQFTPRAAQWREGWAPSISQISGMRPESVYRPANYFRGRQTQLILPVAIPTRPNRQGNLPL